MIFYPNLGEYHIHSFSFITVVKAAIKYSIICCCNCTTLSISTYYHDGFLMVVKMIEKYLFAGHWGVSEDLLPGWIEKNFLQVVSTYNLHVKNLLAFMKILFEFHTSIFLLRQYTDRVSPQTRPPPLAFRIISRPLTILPVIKNSCVHMSQKWFLKM